jgi:hypothetical protein
VSEGGYCKIRLLGISARYIGATGIKNIINWIDSLGMVLLSSAVYLLHRTISSTEVCSS